VGTHALVAQEQAYMRVGAYVVEELVAVHAVEEFEMYQLGHQKQDLQFPQPSSHGKLPLHEVQCRSGNRTCQIWLRQMRYPIAAVFDAYSPRRVSMRA
jgi:hypothetical protein